jgi:chromate transporter
VARVSPLWQLASVFGLLSVLAVGGGSAVLPEMKALTVSSHRWLTADQFVAIYSLGQLAPGPNMLMVGVIGYRVAGVEGAAVTMLAFFLPASLLCLGAGRLWARLAGWPWREALQRGLAPVAIGLMGAGAVALGRTSIDSVTTAALALAVAVLILRWHVNPALLILASGAAGWLLLG